MSETLHRAISALNDAPKMNIKGKSYSTVATRVEVFRKHFGLTYGITTELMPSNAENLVRVRATIHDGDGRVVATGMGEEDRRNGNVNKTSALENCETSAIGRALAAFGLHGGEYATADEVQTAVHQQETTQNQKGAKPVTGKYGITELKKHARQLAQDVRDAPDTGALLGLLNDKESRDVMNQLISDLPAWWHGDGQDSHGLKGLIDARKQELYDAEQKETA
jgi:hypothetical protein